MKFSPQGLEFILSDLDESMEFLRAGFIPKSSKPELLIAAWTVTPSII